VISKWKYNYTDEEKGMALTIQNLKQEIDKLVGTNEDINREFSQYKYESKKEIERLNNIINECAEDILKELEENHHLSYGVALAIRQKLLDYKELKGSISNEQQ
jgi:ribosomal protein L16 Arg81 hydroxylase